MSGEVIVTLKAAGLLLLNKKFHNRYTYTLQTKGLILVIQICYMDLKLILIVLVILLASKSH